MMNHTIKASSLINKVKIKRKQKRDKESPICQNNGNYKTPFLSFQMLTPFLTGTLDAFPCVTEGKQRLLCMLSKKRPALPLFLSTQISFTFAKLQLFETLSSQRKKTKTAASFFFVEICQPFALTFLGLL